MISARVHASRRSEPGRAGRYVVAVLAVAAAYYAAAKIGLRLAYLHGAVTALWPPVGVGIAALALHGARLWPGIAIADLLVADFSSPLGTVLGQTVGNTLEVVVAAVLLRRLVPGRVRLTRVVEVFALLGCAAVGTLVSAAFGTGSLRLGHVIEPGEVGEVWRTWWLSDLSGALVVTPVILTWAGAGRRVGRREAAEGLAMLAALVLLAEVPSQRDVPYVVFPVLIWAALRLGPRGAATAVLVASSLAVWNTAHNAGPFVRASITDSLLSTQLFLATAALTSLVLAAVTAERASAGAALRSNEERLRAVVDEQTALRRIATLVAGDAPPDALFARVTEEVGRLLGAPSAAIVRYEDDTRATIVGRWPEQADRGLGVGAALPLDGDTVLVRVLRSGEAARIDGYEAVGGALAERLRTVGYRSSIAAPVRVGGRLWGVLVASAHDPRDFRDGAERRLGDFAELVAQALANADAHEQLAASRARIVEAGDAERRRLERNLHDGAQQRLVALALQLRLAGTMLGRDPAAARPLLERAGVELREALDELRELARGIHPAVLTDRGLRAAVLALADRSAVPVEIAALPEDRLPPAVEAAAYYIIAEAITNVAKYANASHVRLTVEHDTERALVEVSDDGVGGADADADSASGLRGIADRVDALEGRLVLSSPPGEGTRIRAEIPLRRSSGAAVRVPMIADG